MTTKERIVEESLTLFSEKGYSAVLVGDIAQAVGIKAPSLYKHFKSKRDIFEAILAEMQRRYEQQTAALHMDGVDPTKDVRVFSGVSEDVLVEMGLALFRHFLHDSYVRRFRKMLTLEQFQNADLASLYTQQYVDGPLCYQSAMLAMLVQSGSLTGENASIMALQFYAPLYLLLTACDRQPEREEELSALVEAHIRQFSKIYGKEGAI